MACGSYQQVTRAPTAAARSGALDQRRRCPNELPQSTQTRCHPRRAARPPSRRSRDAARGGPSGGGADLLKSCALCMNAGTTPAATVRPRGARRSSDPRRSASVRCCRSHIPERAPGRALESLPGWTTRDSYPRAQDAPAAPGSSRRNRSQRPARDFDRVCRRVVNRAPARPPREPAQQEPNAHLSTAGIGHTRSRSRSPSDARASTSAGLEPHVPTHLLVAKRRAVTPSRRDESPVAKAHARPRRALRYKRMSACWHDSGLPLVSQALVGPAVLR